MAVCGTKPVAAGRVPRWRYPSAIERNQIVDGDMTMTKMMKTNSRPMPGWALAILATLGSTAGAMAADERTTAPEVLVTATRLGGGIPAASVTVIEEQEIRRSTARTLPDLLGLEAGIQSRDLFGATAGTNATVDMRGFGAPASSNVLVLLDGRRLNDIDLAAVDFAAIPLDRIQRIEILRGNAGAVLYGDGAQGGVINIITKSPAGQPSGASADLSVGSFNTNEGAASATVSSGGFSLYSRAGGATTDGYRVNNDVILRNFSSELRHVGGYGQAFVKLGLDSESTGLPGARRVTLTSNQLETDRRGATTPLDKATQSGVAVTAGIIHDVSDQARLILDGGVRSKAQEATIISAFGPAFNSYLDSELTTWSLTPRAIIDHSAFGHGINTVVGIDFYHAQYDSDRKRDPLAAPIHVYDASQDSVGLYVQNTVALDGATDVHAGLRGQWIRFGFGDRFDPAAPSAFGVGAPPLSDDEAQYAANLGLEHRLRERLAVFARTARSFRLPTVDERTRTDTGDPNLRTQTSWDVETGLRYGVGPVDLQSSVFLMETRNELRFNPSLGGGFGANSNLDPLRRIGFENSANLRLTEAVRVKASVTLMDTEFTEGTFSGREVPLVSNVVGHATLFWDLPEDLRAAVTASYFGNKRLDNDEANRQPTIPGYALVDAKIGGPLYGFTWSAEVANLLDRDYYDYGVASTTTLGTYNAYPLPGRTVLLRLGRRF